ncbi:MAG: siroheme decarboxylase subunit alpha [Armatimonadota bacterium]
MSTELSSIEKAILELIQTGFPISADPYAEIGDAVGCAREEAHATVVDLRRRGVIRRIGGSFAADKLGYISTLVASRVAPENLEAAAEVAGAFPEVTHNYERAAHYNLWFTVIAESQARMDEILDAVRRAPGVEAVHSLPALRTFKIKVDFKFKEEHHAG